MRTKGEGRSMETSSILPQSLTKEKKDLMIEMAKIISQGRIIHLKDRT